MTNDQIGSKGGGLKQERPYDIKERTFLFARDIVRLVKRLPRNVAGDELGRQVLRSGTGVGANVEEADGAESRRDFIHKLSIATKKPGMALSLRAQRSNLLRYTWEIASSAKSASSQ